jgi:hypothetical protein
LKKKGGRAKKPGAREALFRTRWIHVFEEDTADGEVYRPETEDVPLSRRPRRRFSLSPDGTARVLVAGPDDRFVEIPARWVTEGEPVPESAYRAAGKAGTVIRILERSPTRLVVSKSK